MLAEELAVMRVKFDALEARVGLLEAQRGLRDPGDAAAIAGLARAYGSALFTAADAIGRSRYDDALREAVEAAGVQSARELGWLLRHVAGVDVGGLQVTRARTSTKGHVWRVSVSSE